MLSKHPVKGGAELALDVVFHVLFTLKETPVIPVGQGADFQLLRAVDVSRIAELSDEFVAPVMQAKLIGSAARIVARDEDVGPALFRKNRCALKVVTLFAFQVVQDGGKYVHLRSEGLISSMAFAPKFHVERDVGLLMGDVREMEQVSVFEKLLSMISRHDHDGLILIRDSF